MQLKNWPMVSQIESDRAKRAGNVAQVEEHLPTNYKVLSSNPSTTKKKRGLRCSHSRAHHAILLLICQR
jgi:hypothetical protein